MFLDALFPQPDFNNVLPTLPICLPRMWSHSLTLWYEKKAALCSSDHTATSQTQCPWCSFRHMPAGEGGVGRESVGGVSHPPRHPALLEKRADPEVLLLPLSPVVKFSNVARSQNPPEIAALWCSPREAKGTVRNKTSQIALLNSKLWRAGSGVPCVILCFRWATLVPLNGFSSLPPFSCLGLYFFY